MRNVVGRRISSNFENFFLRSRGIYFSFRRKIRIHSEAETPFEIIPIASRMGQQKFIAHVPKYTCSLFGARNYC